MCGWLGPVFRFKRVWAYTFVKRDSENARAYTISHGILSECMCALRKKNELNERAHETDREPFECGVCVCVRVCTLECWFLSSQTVTAAFDFSTSSNEELVNTKNAVFRVSLSRSLSLLLAPSRSFIRFNINIWIKRNVYHKPKEREEKNRKERNVGGAKCQISVAIISIL